MVMSCRASLLLVMPKSTTVTSPLERTMMLDDALPIPQDASQRNRPRGPATRRWWSQPTRGPRHTPYLVVYATWPNAPRTLRAAPVAATLGTGS